MGLLVSILVCSGSLFLVGPSEMLHLPKSITLTFTGLALLGIGISGIIVPIIPELLESIQEEEFKIPKDGQSNEDRPEKERIIIG